MSFKEQAEALGIPVVDEGGKAVHHKTLERLVNEKLAENEEPKSEPIKPIESSDLLRIMAEQRLKTGKLNPYAKVNKPRKRKFKTRSKIHSQAADK